MTPVFTRFLIVLSVFIVASAGTLRSDAAKIMVPGWPNTASSVSSTGINPEVKGEVFKNSNETLPDITGDWSLTLIGTSCFQSGCGDIGPWEAVYHFTQSGDTFTGIVNFNDGRSSIYEGKFINDTEVDGRWHIPTKMGEECDFAPLGDAQGTFTGRINNGQLNLSLTGVWTHYDPPHCINVDNGSFSGSIVAIKITSMQPNPSTTMSWYINVRSNESDQDLYNWIYSKGYEAGKQDLAIPGTQYSLTIFHFGRPEILGSVYGASGYGRFLSTTVISEAVKRFSMGYYFGVAGDSQSQVRIVVGTSNHGPDVTYSHGQSWAQMVKDIGLWLNSTVYGSQANVRGGSDIEVDWSAPETAFAWVDGYVDGFVSPYWLYEFGDAGGCPQHGSTSVPGGCNNGWTQADVERVSWGVVSYPVPQIYSTVGGNAKQWQQIALYSYLAYNLDMFLVGPLSQNEACAQRGGCQGIDNTPDKAWNQLWTELNNDGRTAQDMWYSTDIKWRQ